MRDWIDAHATWLFIALVVMATAGAVAAWQRRAAPSADAPVPMLRKRTASAVLAAAAGVFALLAWAMLGEGRLVALDLRVHAFVRDVFGSSTLGLLAWITHLGDDNVLIVLSVAVALALLWRRLFLLAGLWVFALLGNGLLIRILKDAFARSRPLHDHGFALETGYSFPSGHAAGSLVFYGMLAYVLLALLPVSRHRTIVGSAIGIVVITGLSRVLLQVHYLSDVFAGYALGLAWLALCVGIGEFLRTARGRAADR